MVKRGWTSLLGGAAGGVMALVGVLTGCTSPPPADMPDVPATSTDPAEPQAAVKATENSTATAEKQPMPEAGAPQSVHEEAVPPSDEAPPQVHGRQQNPREQIAREDDGRVHRTVFYRADAKQPPSMPAVVLSEGHQALCRVKVGDMMPEMELEQLGGGRRRFAELAGKKATVVVFWKSDRRMTREQLADLGPDVVEPFGGEGVAVIGIAVGESSENARAALERTGADFPNLLDADGKAFAQVGAEKLPRTYLLDPQGKILWFDIEYSLSTRRELHQALRALLVEKP
jgi:peroxiredoxin